MMSPRRIRKRRSFPLSVTTLEGRSLLSVGAAPYQFDFGPTNSPVAAGSIGVDSTTNYTVAQGYGFIPGAGQVLNFQDLGAGAGTALTRDFAYTDDSSFQVDLPNGIYDVSPTMGDLGAFSHVANVYVQGNFAGTVATTAGQVTTPTYMATVTNGHLVLRLQGVSSNGGNGFALIEGLSITPQAPLQFDFGPTNSPVAAGYAGVDSTTNYTVTQGYGFIAGAGQVLNFQDLGAGVGTALTRDFAYTDDSSFQVDLPNGVYNVSPTLGDLGSFSHVANVFLQGNMVATVATAAGQVTSPTYTATVTNGHLVLRLQGVSGNGGNGFALIEGLTIAPTAPTVIDNGQSGYAETGAWSDPPAATYGTTGYNGGSWRYSAPGDGSTTAAWQFSNLAPGSYDVQVTWFAFANRATNAPYRIYDGTTLLATIRVNQQTNPLGATRGGVAFQSLGQFNIASGTLRIVLGNDANGYVIADAAHAAVPAVTPTAPAIVANGQPGYSEARTWSSPPPAYAHTGYNGGSWRYTPAGDGTTTATWQLSNLATGAYDVQMTWYAFANRATNAPFRIYDGNMLVATVRVNQQQSPVGTAVGGVMFQSLGQFNIASGTLKVVLGDDANGYVIADSLRVTTAATASPPAPTVLDNGQAGYTEVGPWANPGPTYANTGYNGGGWRFAAAGNGSTTATWQFAGIPAGKYDVKVTWYAFANRATNAPYRIYDGNTLLATVRVNQKVAPSGTTIGGVGFFDLGMYTISGGPLKIVLGNDADGYVVADAVQIQMQ